VEDAKLKTVLCEAFLPYAKGFAKDHPDQVTVTVSVTKRTVQGTVTYSSDDFEALLGDTFPRDEMGSAFRALVCWNDSRSPSLVVTGVAC
jgi:hypothetical protein